MSKLHVSYYRCNESTVEVRSFNHTGFLIRYRQLIRTGGKRVWKTNIFRTGNTNYFGALRDFMRDRRLWQGRYWIGEIVDMRQTGRTESVYMDSSFLCDD